MKPEDLPTPKALEELLNEFKNKNAAEKTLKNMEQEKEVDHKENSMEEYTKTADFDQLLNDFIDELNTPKDERVNSYLIDRSDEIQAEDITDELQKRLDGATDEYFKVFDEDDFDEYSSSCESFDDVDLSDDINDDNDNLNRNHDDEEDDSGTEEMEDYDSLEGSDTEKRSDSDSSAVSLAQANTTEDPVDRTSNKEDEDEETDEDEDLEFQRLYESFLRDELTDSPKEEETHKKEKTKEVDPLEELMALTGLEDVKKAVQQQLYFSRIMKMRKDAGKEVPQRLMHLLLTGNPGTGKTTVAKLIGRIYQKEGILEKGHLVEASRASLVGEYIGQTEKKVLDTIEEAEGGILFIDEIYSLAERSTDGNENNRDFGLKVIDTLMPVLDKVDSNLVVIGAGYPNKIRNFLQTNPGLTSRFPTVLDFRDFSLEELEEIALNILKKYDFIPTEGFIKGLESLLKEAVKVKDHGNARMANTIINNYVIPNLCTRLSTGNQPISDVEQTSVVLAEDLPSLEQLFPLAEKKRRMGY